MPPAGRSSKRRINVVESDQEEEDAPHRRSGQARPRHSVAVKEDSDPGDARRRRHEDDDHDDDDDDDDDLRHAPKLGNVLPQYLHQPLRPSQAENRLKLLINDLKLLRKDLSATAELLADVAAHVASSKSHEREADLGEDEVPEDPVELHQLEQQYCVLLDKIKEIDTRTSVLSDLRQKLAQGHPITNLFKDYDERTQDLLRAYDDQTPRQKYLHNDQWKSFKSLVWEQLYDGKDVPNLKRFLPAQTGDAEDSDDEIEIGPQSSNFKCPLTLALLEDPVTSNLCPHSYSRGPFVEFLRPGPQDCPVHGCPVKKMTIGDVHDDPGLKRRVEAHKRRLADERANPGTQTGTAAGLNRTQWETVEDSDDDE